MKRCLIDAGPLIALFNKDDKFHILIKEFIKNMRDAYIHHGQLLLKFCVC